MKWGVNNRKNLKTWNLSSTLLNNQQAKKLRNLEVIGISKDFLNRTPATQQLRVRMDKWDYMKLKSFCTTKEIVF
jgi:phage-related protein